MELFLMHQIITVLFATTNKIQLEGDKVFTELTTRQFMTIVTIAHIPEDECTMNHIAKKMGTSKQNIKQIIVSLMKKDILYLVDHPTDKRAKNIIMTEKGKALFKQECILGNKFLEDVGRNFSEQELQQLWQLLTKLFAYNQEKFMDYHSGYKGDNE